MTVRVLVCGCRDYQDGGRVYAELDKVHAAGCIAVVIQGGASGADRWAKSWAKDRGVECVEYPADWKTHGRGAGPIRNAQMLADGRPDIVVAFSGGRGTENMVSQATAAGVEVLRVS